MSRLASTLYAVFTLLSASCVATSAVAPLPAIAAEAKPVDIDILRLAAQGDAIQLKGLLAKGGNPDAVDSRGVSALWIALGSGNAAVVEALLDAGAKGINVPVRMPDGNLVTPIYTAAMRGNTNIVRALLARGADPQWRDNRKTDIVFQLVNWPDANVETLGVLLDSGVKLDNRFKDGATYLMAAALTGKPETVQLLLDRKANPNDVNNGGISALDYAMAESREDIVDILLANGARTDLFHADGYTTLDYISQIENAAARESIRQKLVAKGATKLTKNRPMDEAFLTAVKKGDMAGVEKALQQGADLHVRVAGTFGGRSALHMAMPYPAVVKLLLDRGISANVWCGGTYSALHEASAVDASPDSIRLLVERGADINGEHKYGGTPLAFVIKSHRKDKAEIVALLLQLGANPDGRMRNGEPSMLTYARTKGLKEIETLLINAGATVAQQ
ncbi:Ankyrin repeat [Duganella sp. CF458]|uniref:ankyrin repeat domain-containing protein n=1 Tax=Duganella sp. CF458 TaxID=1884368 RepID=UPI0008F2B55D|nr:ankyrin repeat domain-containing protein [Duganella sp. CF458]SFG98540.1 Ankyrin repeat [Duganella sp. CF458]